MVTTLETVEELFSNYYGPGDMPEHPGVIDRLVRYSVWRLPEPENRNKAMRIITDAGPLYAGKYLVGALHEEHQETRELAASLLTAFGPERSTLGPLIGATGMDAFGGKSRIPHIIPIVIGYGPTGLSLNYLSKAAHNPEKHDALREIFLHYETTQSVRQCLEDMTKSSNTSVSSFAQDTLSLMNN